MTLYVAFCIAHIYVQGTANLGHLFCEGDSSDRRNLTAASSVFAAALKLGGCTMQAFLSDRQVAQRYNISRVTVWRWVKSKGFPQPVRLMGSTRWKLADLEWWEGNQ